jgi:hypothetical protein
MPDDPRREGGRDPKTTGAPTQEEAKKAGGGSRTAGTNRDFDESDESKNQGHGHPRGDRELSKES